MLKNWDVTNVLLRQWTKESKLFEEGFEEKKDIIQPISIPLNYQNEEIISMRDNVNTNIKVYGYERNSSKRKKGAQKKRVELQSQTSSLYRTFLPNTEKQENISFSKFHA